MIYRTGISLAGMIAAAALPLKAVAPSFSNAPGGNDFPTSVPCGKTLVIPLVTDDEDGDAVSYTVTSSNPHVMARVRSGDFHYKVTVHSDNDGTGAALDGDMEFQMFRNVTPETSSAIAGFAQSGKYDNVLFHRVIPNFVIQGGDFDKNNGSGASPYSIPHEFRPELIYTGRGQLAMANSAGGYKQTFPESANFRYRTGSFEATNGSQFFVTLAQPRHLDYKHTLFGQLVRGFPILDKIEDVPTDSDNPAVENPADKPVTPVKMASHAVTASRTDAVLLISAKNTGTATLTVTARDSSGQTAAKTFTINAVVDDTNDPPMLLPFEPQVAPVGGFPGVSINSFDLEHDAISTRIPVQDIFNPSSIIYAGVSAANLSVIAPSSAGAWDIAFGVAQLNDPLLESDPFSASRFQTLEIGLGDKALIAQPRTLEAEAGTSTGASTVLATFRHGAASASPEDYIAVVQWGDGSSVQTSTGTNPAITVARSATEPGAFEVRGAHTYARPGIYPVRVILDAQLGATDTARSWAAVSAPGAVLRATGEHIAFRGATISGRPIAYFRDSTPGARPADYSTIIDWGDGQRTSGTIRQVGTDRFAVFGTHRYADPEGFGTSVIIKRNGTNHEATAWGRIDVFGFNGPQHLPPFSKANLTGLWAEDPSKSYRKNAAGLITGTDVTGTLFLLNGGDKPTGRWKLQFWVTDDELLEKGTPTSRALGTAVVATGGTGYKVGELLTVVGGTGSTATTLVVTAVSSGAVTSANIITTGAYSVAPTNAVSVTGGSGAGATFNLAYTPRSLPQRVKFGPLAKQLPELALNTLPPGAGGNLGLKAFPGGDFTLRLPAGETGAGKYIIAEMVYSDPITDKMKVPKTVPFGPLTGIITRKATTPTFTIREDGAENQGTAKFYVRLDTLPTAEVKIPLDITQSGVVNTTRAELSTNELTFTPQNGTTEQEVIVTAKDDGLLNSVSNLVIRLKAATSADSRFNKMDAPDIGLPIVDFPRNVVVTPLSLTVKEGLAAQTFKVRLQTKPDEPVTVPLEIVDANGNVDVSRATLDKSSLAFTAGSTGNGTTDQIVTVTAIDDSIANGNANFTIRVKPAIGGGTSYNNRDGGDVALTVQDNDTVGIAVSLVSLPLAEGGPAKTFTVRLQTAPTSEVTIPLAILNTSDLPDQTRLTLSATQLVFTPENATTAQTVTVTPVNDTDVNGTGIYKLKISPAVSADTDYNGKDPADIELSIVDDDGGQN